MIYCGFFFFSCVPISWIEENENQNPMNINESALCQHVNTKPIEKMVPNRIFQVCFMFFFSSSVSYYLIEQKGIDPTKIVQIPNISLNDDKIIQYIIYYSFADLTPFWLKYVVCFTSIYYSWSHNSGQFFYNGEADASKQDHFNKDPKWTWPDKADLQLTSNYVMS